MAVDFAFDFRGNEALSLAPQAGDTRWTVRSSWPSPSFGGDFLPAARQRRATRASTRPIGSAISRSAGRWSAPAMPGGSRLRRPPSRSPTATAATTGSGSVQTRADQPDPAGRSLFAGQSRDQIRLPVHRLHLPRAADVRRDRRRARVGGRISADGRGAGAVLRAAARLRRSDRLHARLHPRLGARSPA